MISKACRHARSLALIFSLGLTGACFTTRGPGFVADSHTEYNKVISQVLKEELLLNIVRRRYLEAPQFLSVASINAAFSTTASFGTNGSIADVGGANVGGIGVDANVAFADSPTITFTPRQGEDIATQLHAPLSVSTVSDLVTAGYPIDVVINLLVEGINGVRGPDLTFDGFRAPSAEWKEMLGLIVGFYREGSLIVDRFRWNDPFTEYPFPADKITPEMWITTLSTGSRRWKSFDGGQTFHYTTYEMHPAIWLDPEVRETPDGQRLMELLNIDPAVYTRIWELEPARVAQGQDFGAKPKGRRPSLKLRMRSLYNVLNLYSCAVQVPASDEAEGRASDHTSVREAMNRDKDTGFGMQLTIKSSESVPDTPVLLRVQYRDRWFYIDDHDLASKAGFNSLYDLWQLVVKGPGSQGQPVTTIQVN